MKKLFILLAVTALCAVSCSDDFQEIDVERNVQDVSYAPEDEGDPTGSGSTKEGD